MSRACVEALHERYMIVFGVSLRSLLVRFS